MQIRFEWFWSGFDNNDNFFVDLLRKYGHDVIINNDPTAKVDLEILSVFAPRNRNFNEKLSRYSKKPIVGATDVAENYKLEKYPSTLNAVRRVWYTGENIRPPYSIFYDGTLSFDQDTFNGTNSYLPLWYLEAGLLKPTFSNHLKSEISIDNLTKKRKLLPKKRKFACAFVGNPHPMRMRAIEELSRYRQVDVFGPGVGKPIANKKSLAQEYDFQICFENDLYPGYVTEKLIDAYMCESVPLYWGDLGANSALNSSSFLNLIDFQDLSQFIQYVVNLSKEGYQDVYEQELVREVPDLEAIYTTLTGEN